MQTIVLHMDMNSYFARVAQQDDPSLRGKPVGVCEHLGGIIIGASVEAKRWGITTGTPVWEARRLYPKIVLMRTQPARYRMYTERFLRVLADYTDQVEKYSIDEAFLDITACCNIRQPTGQLASSLAYQLVSPWEEAIRIAKEIKQRMKTEVGDWLTCSIGIADCKLVAKIASDLKKPDGLTVVLNDECKMLNTLQSIQQLAIKNQKFSGTVISKADLYSRLKLTDIPGIAKRMEKRLNDLGIKTLLDLKQYPESKLVAKFGILGHHLYNMGQLRGSWKASVEEDEEIKSIGHMYTLPQEYRKPEFFTPVLYKLCEMVAKRLRRQGLMGNVVHVYTRDKNYEGFGQSKRLGYYLYDGREIFLECINMLKGVLPYTVTSLVSPLPPSPRLRAGNAKGRRAQTAPAAVPPLRRGGMQGEVTGSDSLPPFKLIGVTVSGLVPYINQSSLFGDAEKTKRITEALDAVNEKYGDFTLCRLPVSLASGAFQDSVGFGRMKEMKIRRYPTADTQIIADDADS